MSAREDVARAVAFFEATDDLVLLHQLTIEVAPRAKRLVGQLLASGDEDAVPPPADIRAARAAATQQEALKTLKSTNDFALLQVMARAIGRRIEAAEIAASADFPEGVRVTVPAKVAFPPPAQRLAGVVEQTGTFLTVLLDNGESWEGPPSLARLESAS
ncbi:hypothetical protein AYO38_06375 [bacterium SCGC AG-212-C10]|nr:hypothetical protein AYO38_06375 [bacterium SCGC AG-212-C10]